MSEADSAQGMKTLLAYIVSPILIVDRKDRLIYLNPSGQKAFDRSLRQILGKEMAALLPEEQAQQVLGGLDGLRQGQEQVALPMELGELVYTVTLSPVRGENDVYSGALLHFLDTTGEQRYQRMKNELLSTMVNEVLTAQRSVESLLTDLRVLIGRPGGAGLADRERAGWQTRIRQAAEASEQIQSHLKQILQVETQSDEAALHGIEKKSLNLQALLRNAAQAVTGYAERSGVLINTLAPDPRSTAEGDSGKLNFVLVNLLSFALHHTPMGGSLTLAGERQAQPPGAWITLAWNGNGFSSEEIALILDGKAADADELQIPFLVRIVTAHGGRFSLESVPGVGAAVALWLPGVPAAATSSPTA